MAVICREHRLLFIATPHTGSTAISDLLLRDLGGEWIPREELTAPDGTLVKRKHSTLQQLLKGGVITPEERSQLFAFAAVRNPFDTLVSTYVRNREHNQPLRDRPDSFIHDRKRKREDLDYCLDHTFEEWIDHSFSPRLVDRLLGRGAKVRRKAPYQEGVDFVLRYEHLQEDFDEALRRAGVAGRYVIPSKNVTTERTDRDYRTWYTPRTKAIVEQVFGEQLQRFGYTY